MNLFDILLLIISIAIIIAVTIIFDGSYWSLASSLLGVTSILFIAKGMCIGQVISIAYCLVYAYTSFISRYYGETITYIVMTLPLSIASLITWLKNLYKNSVEVKVGHMSNKSWIIMAITTVLVFIAFYFLLKYLNTANLIVSTISIGTSYTASYLALKRSPYYAVAYALNDIVLLTLWTMESFNNIAYLSLAISSFVYLINDLYGLYNWSKIKKRQKEIQTTNQ